MLQAFEMFLFVNEQGRQNRPHFRSFPGPRLPSRLCPSSHLINWYLWLTYSVKYGSSYRGMQEKILADYILPWKMAFVISDSERTLWCAQIYGLARAPCCDRRKRVLGCAWGVQQCVLEPSTEETGTSVFSSVQHVAGAGVSTQRPFSAFHSWFYKDEFQSFEISPKRPQRKKNHRNEVSCFYGEGGCGYVGSRHFCVCCGTPFRSFTVPLLGSGLALPAGSLKSLRDHPPGLGKHIYSQSLLGATGAQSWNDFP